MKLDFKRSDEIILKIRLKNVEMPRKILHKLQWLLASWKWEYVIINKYKDSKYIKRRLKIDFLNTYLIWFDVF